MRTMNLYKQIAPGSFKVVRVTLNDTGSDGIGRTYNLGQRNWYRRRVVDTCGQRGFFPRAHFDPGCKRTWRRNNQFQTVRDI